MNSIDNLKAVISKKGGLAMQNRFQIFFTPPTANSVRSLLNQDIGSLIGDLAKNAISGGSPKNLIPDPRDISILCESVNLPGRQITTIDYQAEKQSIKIPYGYIHDDISLSFLLTNDYYMKTVFDTWINSIINMETYTVAYKKDITCDVIIQQLDEKNTPIYGVKLEGAFPTTINEIVLSNDSTDTIQKLNVSFSYDRYVPEGAISSTGSAIRNALSIFG